jgi:hypothetical protein
VGKNSISLLFFSQTEVKSSGKEQYFFAFLLTNRGKIKWELGMNSISLLFFSQIEVKSSWERT